MHWMGVFYHEGFGVAKDINKALSYLKRAAEGGNGQSWFQLYVIHCGKEGQDQSLKDATKAYDYLMQAVIRGVTYWDECISFFKANFSELAPAFVKSKSLSIEVNDNTKEDILKMHDAFIGELRNQFSNALQKDRLYHRPCGHIND